jgi:hypothetical protein
MKKLQVSLPDDLRSRVETAAERNDRALGEEIRSCIQAAYSWDQFDAPTQVLMHLVGRLAVATELQTGRTWWHDPSAHFVFRQALAILLGRRKPEGDLALLDPAELPADRPVAVTDLHQMAAGLEAIVSMDRALSAEEQLALLKGAEATRQGVERLNKALETPARDPRSRGGTTGLTRRKPREG